VMERITWQILECENEAREMVLQLPITIGSIICRSPKGLKGLWIFYLISST
jgi:hypothetical protein